MHRNATALLLLTAIAVPPAAAEEPAVEPVTSAAEENENAADQLPVERDYLSVEASLPYLPTSNTIATKLPTRLEQTPANVGVVTSLLMEEQRTLVLGEALENVSGLNIQTGNGVFDFFVVRGFDSLSSGLILTDGAPEPETTFYHLYNAERVEVFKGPAGFLYGSNPLAGAVNIVREQPVPSDFGAVGVAFGSFGSHEASVDLNRSNDSGSLSFRLNGLWRESDGYRDRVGNEALAFNPALHWLPDESSSLNLNFELVSSDFQPDAGLPIVGGELVPVNRGATYHSPFDLSEQDIGRFQVDYERQLSPNATIRNKAYYRSLDWNTNGTLFGFVVPTPTGSLAATRSLLLLEDDQVFLGNQFELLTSLATGKVTHTLMAGLEAARFADDYTLDVALLPAIDLFQPFETAARPLFRLPGLSAAGDSTSDVLAPYLVDQIALSPRVEAMVGLRYDSIDFEDTVSGTKRSDGELSPMVGVVFSPAPSLSLYANAGQSFSPASPRVVGDRRPERSRQAELGLRKELAGGRLRSTFAVYQLERENIAIPDDNGFTQQAGDQRARGFELELAGNFGRGVRGTLVYAYTDSELTRFTESVLVDPINFVFATLDRSGNRSAFAPEHLLNLWVSRRFGERWFVAGGARWVDDQFIAEDNATRLDSYAVVDAAVSYLLGDWKLTLNLKNLTDEDYETRGFGSTSVIPAPPASVSLALEYRL